MQLDVFVLFNIIVIHLTEAVSLSHNETKSFLTPSSRIHVPAFSSHVTLGESCKKNMLLLLSCPSHNVLPLPGTRLCPPCYDGVVYGVAVGHCLPSATVAVVNVAPLLIAVFARPIPVRSGSAKARATGDKPLLVMDTVPSNPICIAAGASVGWLFHICSLV